MFSQHSCNISHMIGAVISRRNLAAWNAVALLTIYSTGLLSRYIILITISALNITLSLILNLNRPGDLLCSWQ